MQNVFVVVMFEIKSTVRYNVTRGSADGTCAGSLGISRCMLIVRKDSVGSGQLHNALELLEGDAE